MCNLRINVVSWRRRRRSILTRAYLHTRIGTLYFNIIYYSDVCPWRWNGDQTVVRTYLCILFHSLFLSLSFPPFRREFVCSPNNSKNIIIYMCGPAPIIPFIIERERETETERVCVCVWITEFDRVECREGIKYYIDYNIITYSLLRRDRGKRRENRYRAIIIFGTF